MYYFKTNEKQGFYFKRAQLSYANGKCVIAERQLPVLCSTKGNYSVDSKRVGLQCD